MELRDFLQTVRRRWMLIVVCIAVAIALAAAWVVSRTPQFSSTSAVFVTTPDLPAVDAYQGGLFSQQRVTSYAQLVTEPTLAKKVIKRLALPEKPQQLVKQVSANVSTGTVIIDITVTDPSPGRAQRIAQTYAQEFDRWVRVLERSPGHKVAPIKATVVQPADLPLSPSSPKKTRDLGLALVLGLLVGVGLAVLRETLDTSVKSARELDELTGASLLGSVRFDKGASKSPLVTDVDTHAPRREAFRMLRTNLQFVDVDRESKVIVVTSSRPAEGKTTTAVNLAITLSEAGQRVLLLEGDLRRPRVADYLHLAGSVGLTSVLVGYVDAQEAIQPWGDTGLHVITSGPIPPNPAELLQSQAMEKLLTTLRGEYQVIIFDASPLLPVTDAAVLAAQSDGALLVVRHAKTTYGQVEQSVEHLRAVDARLLGTVLNMVADHRGADGYGYGYGYGYSYGPEAGRRKG